MDPSSFLTEDSPISYTAIIKDYIESDLNSARKQEMRQGTNYFRANHDILQRKITYLKDGVQVEDKNKANRKLVHAFHRLLVLQKAAYIVGNPIAFTVKDGEQAVKFGQRVNELLGDVFNDKVNQWVQGSANKGVEWLHPYIDKDGNFKYVIIPAEQVIPIYDSSYEEELENIIRYYTMTVVDGNKTKKRYRVELWDKEKVTYFMQQDDDSYAFDVSMDPNPRYHWYSYNTIMPSDVKLNSWGRIPFISLENNDEQIHDLRFTKTLIASPSLTVSDFSNNLAEIQELIWILKGYEGSSLDEFMQNLKTNKAIKLSADEHSGASTESADLPKDARDSHMDRMEDNIFIFGMGVNMKTDKFGNSPSGIALQYMYSLLDLNANILIRKMKGSLKEFMYFVTTYINMKDKTNYDYTKVEFTFNKSMITNTTETITNLKDSVGMISDETIVANHPMVTNVQEELKRLKDQGAEADPYTPGGNNKTGGSGGGAGSG